MVFQGRSIQASVELDLEPLELSITKANEMLGKLGGAFKFDTTSLGELEEYMGKVRDIFKMVSNEALKINEAFSNIQGLKTFIENIEILKAKMETIANDVDKINMAILKSAESTQPVAQGMERVSVFSKEIGTYFANENKLLQSSLSLIRRKEKEMQGLLTIHKGVTEYFANENELMVSSLSLVERKIAEEERELAILGDSFAIRERIASLVKSDTVTEADLVKLDDEQLAILRNIVGEEEKILNVQRQQTAEVGKQNSERMTGGANSRVNQLDKGNYLGRRIGSMAVTMWGFNELMDVYDKTMGHINAESQKNYFADRLNMSAKQLNNYNKELADYQKQYQKLDMTVVGANALETASKYKVENKSLGDLTEVMAIYGSEFVKQGRSQEDSILAINDALDGELRRLKEVGIGAEELKATGLWDGDESDKEGMLKALLQIAQERGYDKTAKDITNLSDAITTLEVKLSIDLARAFGVIEPLLRDVMANFVTMLEALEGAIAWVTPKITEFAKALGLIDKDGNGTKFGNFLEDWASWMITFGITAYGVYKIVKPLVGWLKNLRGATDTVAKTTGGIGNDVGKTMNTGGFKENFKSEWGKLGKNLGKMARVFVEFAVALAMAWALIEEAIILISAIGYTYESLKPQFESGINFIKEFGVWFALLGGAMIGLSYALGNLNEGTIARIGKGALNIAQGIAIAMGVVAVAIGSLLMPMMAIISLGALANWQQGNLDKGIEVIQMFGDALNHITAPVGVFLIALGVASVILGYAPMLGVGLAVGIAFSIGLVAEAIVMLIAPLGAIALLGYTANSLNEADIQQGAETIAMIGRVLSVLADAMVDLVIVDLGVFADRVLNFATQLVNGGKDAMTTLTEDILPSLRDFIKDFDEMDFSVTIDSAKVQAVTTMAEQIPPMFRAVQKLTSSLGGGGFSVSLLGGLVELKSDSGLGDKLDALYEDIRAVMDFARKLGGLSTANGGANSTAIQQTANAITQLKTKLNLFITTISGASARVQSASQKLGNALPTGFRTGSASFGSAVVSVLAKGVSEIQSRYATFNNGGKTLGQKLIDGFKNHKPTLKTITSREIGYALTELDNAKDDFYNKGKSLGEELTRGYQDGADIHSPGLIARTTVRELEYTMEALDTGKKILYQGGVALGQALTNGYNSYGNLRTDVGVLASKGVSNEQLQANAKSVQGNTKGKGQTQESFNPTININMSNSTIIGIQDLNTKIQQAVEQAIVKMNTPNGAIGY